MLEMPTWMARDLNASSRTNIVKADAASLEWMHIFEEGPDFRVRLKPGTKTSVINTFSRIPVDRERRYTIEANSLGFRGHDANFDKPANTFRIVVIGDSSSFGWGVNQDETYAALLEKQLSSLTEPKGIRVEVLNFAIPGDSSEYGRLVFDQVANKFKYDFLIVGFGANDAKLASFPHAQQVARFRQSHTLLKLKKFLGKSAVVQAMEKLLTSLRSKKSPSSPTKQLAVPLTRYIQNLDYFASESKKANGSKTLFINLCTPTTYARAASSLKKENDRYHFNGQHYLLVRAKDLAAGTLYPERVAELKASYPKEFLDDIHFLVTNDDCHPNSIGHQLIADKLTHLLAPLALKLKD